MDLQPESFILLLRIPLQPTETRHFTHHTVDLWFLALGQVNDVHAVVVEVLHTAVEVLAQERSWFSGQRNAADTELCETKKIRTERTQRASECQESLH